MVNHSWLMYLFSRKDTPCHCVDLSHITVHDLDISEVDSLVG